MGLIPTLITFTGGAGNKIFATQVNANYTSVRDTMNTYALFTDVPRTVTVTNTHTVTQTFSGGASFGAAITGTAATLSEQNALTLSHATGRIVPGATSVSLRNNANNADNLLISDAGVTTLRAGLVVTAGGATVTAGGLTVSAGTTAVQALTATSLSGVSTVTANTFAGGAASSKILIGATNLLLRNSADAATIMTVAPTTVTIANDIGLSVCADAINSSSLVLSTGVVIQPTSTGNVVLGRGTPAALATNATAGFVVVSNMAGTPTGNLPVGALTVDTTGSKWWVSFGGGTWKSVALT